MSAKVAGAGAGWLTLSLALGLAVEDVLRSAR